MESHLLQMRGLKRSGDKPRTTACFVASFTDAWIETTAPTKFAAFSLSHLLQMRGLKLSALWQSV